MRNSGMRASLSLQRPRKLSDLEQPPKTPPPYVRRVPRETPSFEDITAVDEKRQLTRQILLERGQIALLRAKLNRQDLSASPSLEDDDILEEESAQAQQLKQAYETKQTLDEELLRLRELYNDAYASELQTEIDFFRDLLTQQVAAIERLENSTEMKRIQFEDLIDNDITREIAQKKGRIEELQQNLADLKEEEIEISESYERLATETSDISELNNEISELERILDELEIEKSTREEELQELISNEHETTPTKNKRAKARRKMSGGINQVKAPPTQDSSSVDRSPRRVHKPRIDMDTDEAYDINRCSRRKLRRSDSSSDDNEDKFYNAMEMMMRRNREEIERKQQMDGYKKNTKKQILLNQTRGGITTSSPVFDVPSTNEAPLRVHFLLDDV